MASFDFLSMCQNVAQDAGLSGSITNVTAVTGDAARVVRYVRESCLAIETRWGDWKFNYKSGYMLALGGGLNTYAAPDDLLRWNKDRMYIDGRKIAKARVYEYHEWHGFQMDGEGDPSTVIIMPDNALMFFPTPRIAATFAADYYKSPAVLAANTDLPNVPQGLCPTIQAYALQAYAQYDASEELMAKAQGDIQIWDALLENSQRPGGTSSDTAYGNTIIISAD